MIQLAQLQLDLVNVMFANIQSNATADDDFKESEHPRDDDGKFGDGPGSNNNKDSKSPNDNNNNTDSTDDNSNDNTDHSINDDHGRIKITVDNNASAEEISRIETQWNNISDDAKKSVFNLHVGSMPKGHEMAVGNFTTSTDTLTINPALTEQVNEDMIHTIIRHEMFHADFHNMPHREKAAYIRNIQKIPPINNYTELFYNQIQELDVQIESNNAARIEAVDKRNEIYHKIKNAEIDGKPIAGEERKKLHAEWTDLKSQIKKYAANETRLFTKSGKLETVYAFEQHAEFNLMENDIETYHKPNPENYERMKSF